MQSIGYFSIDKIQSRFPTRFGFTFRVGMVKNAVLFNNTTNSNVQEKLGITTAIISITKNDELIAQCAVIVDKKMSNRDFIFGRNFDKYRMRNRKTRRFESELNKEACINNIKSKMNKF